MRGAFDTILVVFGVFWSIVTMSVYFFSWLLYNRRRVSIWITTIIFTINTLAVLILLIFLGITSEGIDIAYLLIPLFSLNGAIIFLLIHGIIVVTRLKDLSFDEIKEIHAKGHINISEELITYVSRVVEGGVNDIYEIASATGLSYEDTIDLIQHIITYVESGHKRYKEYHFFAGAYIDKTERRIVFSTPPPKASTAESVENAEYMTTILALFIFGSILLVIGLFMVSLTLFNPRDTSEAFFIITAASFGGMGVLCLYNYYRLRIKRKRYIQYADLISNKGINSVSDIAYNIGKPVEFVRKDLKKFLEFSHSIDKMQNVSIDFERDKALVADLIQ